MKHLNVLTASLLFSLGTLAAGEWTLHPSADKGHAKDYQPAFERHFAFADGVLTGRCALGDDFYKKMEAHNVFVGTGPLWATHATWPADAGDFDFTVEYKWFQQEPMEKYGDFPDLKLGFRLNQQGAGYYLHWGMLGQILIKRLTPEGQSIVVGHGVLAGRKGKWCRIRLRVAGPVLKARIWPGDKPEPETWLAEGYDDWADSKDALYKQGALALGFYGRKLFDTCVYEFRNPVFKALSADESRAEASFDKKTAPAYAGTAPCSDTTPIAVQPPQTLLQQEAAIADWQRDANLKIEGFGEEGVRLSSTDGKPAFLWKKVRKLSAASARLKASAGAQPLLVLKATSKAGSEVRGYLDPVWREGFSALLFQNAQHTSGAFRFQLKPETWYDFVSLCAHWHKWQILETEQPKTYSAYASQFVPMQGEVNVGIGVAGQGTVTAQGVSLK